MTLLNDMEKNSLTISHNLLSSKLNMSTKFGEYESGIFSNTLSLSMIKRESIYFFMCEIFDNALFFRSFPSQRKGVVMMPTEKRFKDFTICATTGAEPVPVKPPNPATIITHDGLFLRIISRMSFSALIVNSIHVSICGHS